MEEKKVDPPLSELIKSYINGRRDSKVVNLLKTKLYKDGDGGINKKLITQIEKASNGNIDLDNKLKEIRKVKKSKNETDLFFQLRLYENLLLLAHECLSVNDIEIIVTEYDKKHKEIYREHDFNTWISNAAENAERVSYATHVIKLTHSSINGASCFYDKSTVESNFHITTAHIKKKIVDCAYDDAKFIPYASFLLLSSNGNTLANKLLSNDYSDLKPFSQDNSQLENWVHNFKKAINKTKKNSHYLAKQVYFPVEGGEYHLLSIIPSSSLIQELFERFLKFWSEDAKVRACKDNNKYSPRLCTSFPGKAKLSVTASLKAHLNVSKLNKERDGIINLLSCQPPVWQNRISPPINKKSLFYTEVHDLSHDTVLELQRLLLAIKNNNLSMNNPKRHAHISDLVEKIIEILFQYVSLIHNLRKHAGWSRDAKKLKLSHQLWLDPFRDDEEFQQKRNTMEWQDDICLDFSLWLNNNLKHKQLTLGKPQEAFWQKIMRPRLRAFNAITEVSR